MTRTAREVREEWERYDTLYTDSHPPIHTVYDIIANKDTVYVWGAYAPPIVPRPRLEEAGIWGRCGRGNTIVWSMHVYIQVHV